jgi:ribosomal protein S1
MGVKLGQEIDAQVQLVKDYGIITQIEGENVQTGFIINDHKGGQGKYKQGQALKCVILDVDPNKKIADLSEKTFKKSDKDIKVGSSCKAIVELNKDSYLICSLKNNRKKFGICIMQNFNMDDHVDQA